MNLTRICPKVFLTSTPSGAQIQTRGFDGRIKFMTVTLPQGTHADQLQRDIKRWFEGVLIQDALPYLSAPEREFVMTGLLPEEFDAMFPPEDEDV